MDDDSDTPPTSDDPAPPSFQPDHELMDPDEHDAFAWCSYREAAEMLDWPVEHDALEGRRSALRELASLLGAR